MKCHRMAIEIMDHAADARRAGSPPERANRIVRFEVVQDQVGHHDVGLRQRVRQPVDSTHLLRSTGRHRQKVEAPVGEMQANLVSPSPKRLCQAPTGVPGPRPQLQEVNGTIRNAWQQRQDACLDWPVLEGPAVELLQVAVAGRAVIGRK